MPLPPPTTTLFEHEYTTDFNCTNSELIALERLNKGAGATLLRPTIRSRKWELQATQYVGVVRLGGRTIQVLPKIHRAGGPGKERIKEATHNLLYLLAYAGQLPVREHEVAPLLRYSDDWFEILTRLFASHLLEEWQRGTYRNYQMTEAESPSLKGKWRIAEQLRRPDRGHVFYVSYDEFTADNALNRIFRFVVERLWRLTRDGANRQMLGDLRQWMEEVTLRPRLMLAEANASVLTRLNQRFAPLLSLALIFLEGGALQLQAGDTQTFAFTFDMNKLFEMFIVNFIRKHRDDILPPTLQACELLPQSKRATRFLARTDGHEVFMLKPDLVFRLCDHFPLLLDTKYKQLNMEESKLGVSEADFYQMHAYAQRYGCKRVTLIYPQTAAMPRALGATFNVEDTDITITAATVNLRTDIAGKQGRAALIAELRNLLRGATNNG